MAKSKIDSSDPLIQEMKTKAESIVDPAESNAPLPDPADFDPDPADQDPAGQDPADEDPADQDPADQDPAGQDPAGQDPAGQERISQDQAEKDAEFYVSCLDTLQTLILPSAYKGVLLTRQERIQIRNLKKKYRVLGKTILISDLTDEEKALMDKFDEIEQLGDLVPYSYDEIEAIKGPLAEILVKYNLKGSPEMRLIMALSLPTAMRIAPLLAVAI